MSKLITDAGFNELVQQGMQKQHGALTCVVGAMRAIPGCDEALLADAQAELRRFESESKQWMMGQLEDFMPLDRNLLARAWADWQIAMGVKDYGWVDCRSTRLPMPVGYALNFRAEQEGVVASVMDDRNPSYPAVVGRYLVNDAGCWVGRAFTKLVDGPQSAIAYIMDTHQEFEAAREARLERRLGVSAA